ncbi:hypothetical protein JF535_15070 [Microbulbifer salipaludis]|uniref:Uncharacterized protein n=1 Tax=Microbulbifer salipaludis TaxID=187980 RepID=A0ABS3EA37_9GAMM|nr:hypothetical protein [Microbulbifer salipaludis]MBN8432172.1 hypothetical protein [Microbulbifer salipaludis]
MKNPYGKFLDSKESIFNKLGFLKLVDNEYVAIFSKNDCAIEISIERYYAPSINTKVIDREGNTYSMRVIRELLDLKNLERDSKHLEDIKSRYKLDDEIADKSLRRKGLEEYVNLSFEQLLGFLSRFSDALCPIDDALKLEYQKRDQDFLRRLGL